MFDLDMLRKAIDEGKFIGEGISRLTIKISDNVVAKMCRFAADTDSQQWAELSFYDKWYDEYSHFMPELYGAVIIPEIHKHIPVLFLEYVTPIEDMTIDEYSMNHFDEEVHWEFMNAVEEFEYHTELGDSSNNSNNWGIKPNGQLCCLDFGLSRDDCCTWSAYNSDGYSCGSYEYSYG